MAGGSGAASDGECTVAASMHPFEGDRRGIAFTVPAEARPLQNSSVIPTNVGTHLSASVQVIHVPCPWVPASAGMTKTMDLRRPGHGQGPVGLPQLIDWRRYPTGSRPPPGWCRPVSRGCSTTIPAKESGIPDRVRGDECVGRQDRSRKEKPHRPGGSMRREVGERVGPIRT